MTDMHADAKKHVRAYLAIFSALLVLTALTVFASRQDFGGSTNVVVALAIAAMKAMLVAAIFMHLKWERSASIWWLLVICAVFVVGLLVLPVLTTLDVPAHTKMGSWG